MLEERGRVRAPPRPSRDAPALRGCIWATTWFASLTGVPSPPRRYDGGGRDPVRKGGCWLGVCLSASCRGHRDSLHWRAMAMAMTEAPPIVPARGPT